jgi:spore coat polysaccharide biosynthesis protein SpsF (cytidylyltransferase family)
MPLAALRRAMEATRPEETYYREHVMTYLIDHPEQFRLRVLEAPREFQELTYRLCVDEEDDLKVVQAICAHFAPRIDFSLSEIVAFLAGQPEIAAMNRHVQQKAV